MLKDRLIYHLLTIVAKEHLIGNDIRTDLQFYQWLRLLRSQRCTVTTKEDGTLDDRLLICCTFQVKRYLLGIRTEGIKALST